MALLAALYCWLAFVHEWLNEGYSLARRRAGVDKSLAEVVADAHIALLAATDRLGKSIGDHKDSLQILSDNAREPHYAPEKLRQLFGATIPLPRPERQTKTHDYSVRGESQWQFAGIYGKGASSAEQLALVNRILDSVVLEAENNARWHFSSALPPEIKAIIGPRLDEANKNIEQLESRLTDLRIEISRQSLRLEIPALGYRIVSRSVRNTRIFLVGLGIPTVLFGTAIAHYLGARGLVLFPSYVNL